MPTDFPLPANVKEVLSRLPVKDQVVLRSYIAGLRDQVIEYKVAAERAADPEDDPHAHYHGHEKCTADHGHDDAHHGKAEDSHEHGHDHGKSCDDAHEHGHDHGKSCCDEKHDDHSHEHGHKEHKEHSHEHKHHEDKDHSHAHGHDHKGDCEEKKAEHKHKHEEMPAWKKRALEEGGDANAAPFGGSWNTETKVSAMDTTK